jgi:hypothetical protein
MLGVCFVYSHSEYGSLQLAGLALSFVSSYKSTQHPLTIKCYLLEECVVLNVICLLFLVKQKHLRLVTSKGEGCLAISMHL